MFVEAYILMASTPSCASLMRWVRAVINRLLTTVVQRMDSAILSQLNALPQIVVNVVVNIVCVTANT